MAAPGIYFPVKGYVRAELIINCIIATLVLIVVSLRVVGRIMGPGLGWDDGFVIAATPLAVAMLVCQGFFARVGNGFSLIEYPELVANVPFILQLTFGMQIVYVTLLALVKASMLCFFIRVFPTRFMQLASKVCLAAVAAWTMSYLCACIFICNPVSAQWTGLGVCGRYINMIQSLIATNALGDVVIMALPMQSIWSLQTRKSEKIGITSCFLLGLACVVCAIFRLIYISTVDLTTNVTGTMPTTIFLFTLEPNLAVLCVSIPMLRPFYAKYKRRMGGSKLDEYSDERSTGFRDRSQQSAPRSKARSGSNPESPSTWEMDNYYPPGKGAQDATITGLGDDGSEKYLTTASGPPNEIRVETGWKITRHDS
ncbi:hypothetical protein B0J13DRAFT_541496 [Dactylonectria estremocensis]|uniref:Rhodopsin domain-containing protein n=1 Tax=Dactylonectria estremocensis TaxID=1079267 RepID=A0A9P9JEK3_9HYPO|nr:hypothetical protein B0J13DRAFT_541496 [Dactylonectria estremocensis]